MNLSATVSAPFSALALAIAALAAVPAGAEGDASAYYRAELAAEQDTGRFAAGGVVWSCEGTACVAPQGRARPQRVCRELSRKAGEILRFEAGGEALPQDRLERCNG